MAGANGFGPTVAARRREPRSQPQSGWKARSRRGCPDPSPGNLLVKRSCDTVARASARATRLPEVRSYRRAVRESRTRVGLEFPPSSRLDGDSMLAPCSCVTPEKYG
jgi:hypothetical protein